MKKRTPFIVTEYTHIYVLDTSNRLKFVVRIQQRIDVCLS